MFFFAAKKLFFGANEIIFSQKKGTPFFHKKLVHLRQKMMYYTYFKIFIFTRTVTPFIQNILLVISNASMQAISS